MAERAGYSRNTLYRHFPERVDLFRNANEFTEEVQHSTPTGVTRTDVFNELKAFRFHLFDGRLGALLATLMERAERDPSLVAMRDQMMRSGTSVMRTILEHAQDRGEIDREADVEALISQLFGPVMWDRLTRGHAPSDAYLASLVDMVVTAAGRNPVRD